MRLRLIGSIALIAIIGIFAVVSVRTVMGDSQAQATTTVRAAIVDCPLTDLEDNDGVPTFHCTVVFIGDIGRVDFDVVQATLEDTDTLGSFGAKLKAAVDTRAIELGYELPLRVLLPSFTVFAN